MDLLGNGIEKQRLIRFNRNPVLRCRIKRETQLACTKLGSREEALNLVTLDEVNFNGVRLKRKSWDKEYDNEHYHHQ